METRVARARSLVGVPFRPQGREPAIGLDCVGLVLCAFDIAAEAVRRDYRLRGDSKAEVLSAAKPWFRRIGVRQMRRGDVLLCRVASDQLHLAINLGETFVHADARLRRVVETPAPIHWPIIAVFRRRRRGKRKSI